MCAKMFTEIAAQVQGVVTLFWLYACTLTYTSSLLIVGDEKETCKLCGKTLRTARGLSIHLSKHIADKKVQCRICANKTLIDL